jgi:hypothetical protein
MDERMTRTRLDQLTEIFKDPDRKPVFQIIYELLYLLIIYKELPLHYFSRYLFKKGTANIKDYLPGKLISKIPSFFNDKKVKEILDNKLFFDFFYRQFNISLPKILMYNHKKKFIIGNRCTDLNTVYDFTILLKDIFDQNPAYDSLFIKKTCSSASGRNIHKLFLHQLRTDPEGIKGIFDEVINSEFLFQEVVKQHPDLNKLTPTSLNTIRFDTYIDPDGKTEIISGFLKISTNNSPVDNSVAGGYGIGIVLQTGKLKKTGYSKIKISGVKVLIEHPVTKTKFEDLSIPFFLQAKELVLKAAGFLPEERLVGWDMGIAESGPMLIEGNPDYRINSNDLMYGGNLANPAFRKVLQEINYL